MDKFNENIPLIKNIFANYIGHIYILILGVAVTPLYWKYLGSEAYGLVGFFMLLLACSSIIDAGLSPTLGRQIAHERGSVNGGDNLKKLLKSFEIIFFTLAALVFLAILLSSHWISTYWIKSNSISQETIEFSIKLMGGIIGIRILSSLYRSGINGLERQIWLNTANIIFQTAKFVLALLVLIYLSADIIYFFYCQIIISIFELAIFIRYFYSKLPAGYLQYKIGYVHFDWKSIRLVAPFTVGILYSTAIWIATSQVDRVILSKVLSLESFGYFSLIMVIASTINMLSTPIGAAIQPRMTYLLANGSGAAMLSIYRTATQLATLSVMTIAITIAMFSEPLVYAWTGNKEIAAWSNEILFWFSLSNGILAIIVFQYYLQVAHGRLRLHIFGCSLSALIEIPIIVYIAINYGALGVGIAWFVLRVIWLFFWVPVVHQKFAPGLHWDWFIKDVLLISAAIFSISLLLRNFIVIDFHSGRVEIFLQLIAIGLFTLSLSSIGSSFIRSWVVEKIKNLYANA